MKVYFPLPITGSFIDKIISHLFDSSFTECAWKFVVKKVYLCTWLLVQKCL